jgi:hypothetical protein
MMFFTLRSVKQYRGNRDKSCRVSALEQQQMNSFLETSRWYTYRQA